MDVLMLAGFSALIPLLMIVAVILIVVAVSKAKKKQGQNTPTVTPPVAYTAPTSVPTELDRLKAEIAALSSEEVHRRYCDVDGRSDGYRYLCYEELERRKGK